MLRGGKGCTRRRKTRKKASSVSVDDDDDDDDDGDCADVDDDDDGNFDDVIAIICAMEKRGKIKLDQVPRTKRYSTGEKAYMMAAIA